MQKKRSWSHLSCNFNTVKPLKRLQWIKRHFTPISYTALWHNVYSHTDRCNYFQFNLLGDHCLCLYIGVRFPSSRNALHLVTMQSVLVCKRDTSAGFTCDRLLYFNQIAATKNWIERASISYKQLAFDLEFPFSLADFLCSWRS